MGDCFHLHCQAGGWDRIGCTVFIDGSCVAPCLTVKHHPDWSVVTESSVYTMRSCGLLFSWMRNLISDSVLPAGHSRQCFPKFFLAGVSHKDAGIGLGIFPTPWFAWALSAGILAVLSSLLDPSKTSLSQPASLCVFHGFVEWVLGIFIGIKVCFDLLHFLSGLLVGGLAWTTWSQWERPWWFSVWLALPRSALCPALADLSVTFLWGRLTNTCISVDSANVFTTVIFPRGVICHLLRFFKIFISVCFPSKLSDEICPVSVENLTPRTRKIPGSQDKFTSLRNHNSEFFLLPIRATRVLLLIIFNPK